MSKKEGIILAVLTAMIWGVVPPLMKAGLLVFSGNMIVSTRLVGSLAALYLYIRITGRNPHWRPFPKLAILGGVALAVNHFLFLNGLNETTAIATNIIIQVATVLMVLTGVLLLREKMTSLKAIGTSLALVGVGVIIWNGTELTDLLLSSQFTGNLMVLGAATIWPVYGYSQVMLNRRFPPSEALLFILIPASLVSLVAYPTFSIASSVGPADILVLTLVALFVVVPYGFLARSFKSISSSTAIIITTLSTAFTPLTVFIFKMFEAPFVQGESFSVFTVMGAALILLGIFFAVKVAGRK